MAQRKVTVKDLARICGVSIGTIDRAINDRGGINPGTKKKILEAARANGFVKNQTALSLSSGRPTLIGVIITALNNEFQTTMLTAIEEEARRRGFSTLIMLSGFDEETEFAALDRMLSMSVAGIITFSVARDAGRYLRLSETLPVVAVGNRIDGRIPFVGIDDRAAMRAGTKFVAGRGYDRLVYVAPLLEREGTQNMRAQIRRRDGFLDAVRESGVRCEMIDSYEKYNGLGSYVGVGRMAVVCSSDVYTVRCLPFRSDSVGVMGFDRLGMIGSLVPDLSGVVYPTSEIGRSAVSVLLDGGEDMILPYETVEGGTV